MLQDGCNLLLLPLETYCGYRLGLSGYVLRRCQEPSLFQPPVSGSGAIGNNKPHAKPKLVFLPSRTLNEVIVGTRWTMQAAVIRFVPTQSARQLHRTVTVAGF